VFPQELEFFYIIPVSMWRTEGHVTSWLKHWPPWTWHIHYLH